MVSSERSLRTHRHEWHYEWKTWRPGSSKAQPVAITAPTSIPAATHPDSQPSFTVAICGISPGPNADQFLIAQPLQEALGPDLKLVVRTFEHIDNPEMAQLFDLVILYLNPAPFSSKGRISDAYGLVSALISKYKAPIVLLTNKQRYDMDCADQFRQAGAEGLFSFLDPLTGHALQAKFGVLVHKSR